MRSEGKYIKFFEEISLSDVAVVGGKNASLGEMITKLSGAGVRIPTGFAITADAYWYYLNQNHMLEEIKRIMGQLQSVDDVATVQKVGSAIRDLMMRGVMPQDLSQEIIAAYNALCAHYNQDNCDVAVRSSATAEDLPQASFAGQHDTYLNVSGSEELLNACKKSMASLFNDRAIVYRINQGFDHFKVALSVGVQKMIRSDRAVSGVAFSLDTETGFKDVVMIEASYGLGESIVQGSVSPDEYVVYKPMLACGYMPIIKKFCGEKKTKIIYQHNNAHDIETVEVPIKEQRLFALSDEDIIELSRFVVIVEDYYSQKKGSWSPMDIEWAKDGLDNKLYIVQARPETIYAGKNSLTVQQYVSLSDSTCNPLVTGLSIGHKIVSGVARVVRGVDDISSVKEGDIIVTTMTDPDWVPVMKRAAGIVTDQGGRTCHAAIVSRELGICAIVGTKEGTAKIHDGSVITLDCSRGATGFVCEGKIEYTINEISCDTFTQSDCSVMVNCADPDGAFQISRLPVAGVGLARLEFIITNFIKVHPMALLFPDKIDDEKIRSEIDCITSAYSTKEDFFVETLSQGIGMIAAAFYPRSVTVRLSDFKSNEYRNLIGGKFFEPVEENPMIGFRGASRYYNDRYKKAFALECAALKRARNFMGLKNIKIMVPFVRTVTEAGLVIAELKAHGLVAGQEDLELVMMCEIPSNVLMMDELSVFFDGFSIGSNDLTQLTLGVDRDSTIIAQLFDERDPAVKKMMSMAIEGAHRNKRYIGICGQAPSDYPEIADFLIAHGIDSLSLNADSCISFLTRIP